MRRAGLSLNDGFALRWLKFRVDFWSERSVSALIFERARMPFQPGYTPWNKGKNVGQKRPFKLGDIAAIKRACWKGKGQVREPAMFNLAIDSKLRACDLIALRIEDVSAGGRVRDRASVMQRKTSCVVHLEIRGADKSCFGTVAKLDGQKMRFPFFRVSATQSVIFRYGQYARIVDTWVKSAGLEKSLYATHTLRRTKATILYRKTGNLRAVQLLLGHKSIENTIRYLGIEVDDALELAGQIDI